MKNLLKSIVIIIIFFSLRIEAQEIDTMWDFEVTTASKTSEKQSDAPGIITVISKDEISSFGALNLSSILNRVTSMYMIHAGTFMWNVGSIRGQNISNSDNHVLILINGRPYRDGMSGGFNNITYASFPIDIIEQIEVIRGPGSVLYGTNAYSGVINLITKTATESTEFKLTTSYGSYNTKSGTLSGGVNFAEDFNLNFGINYLDDDGPEFEFMDTPFQIPMGDTVINIAPQEGKGKFTRDNKSIFLNLNFKNFHLNTIYSELSPYGLTLPFKWNMNANPPYKAGEEMTSFKKYFADLGYTFSFHENYKLDINLTYNWFKAEGWVQDDDNPNATKGLTYNPMLEAALNATPIEDLNLIIGGLVDYNQFEGAQMTQGNLLKYNAYAQADYRVKWIKFILGGQYNKIENLESNFSPRIGLIANINDQWGIKTLYSTALRNAYPIETHVNHPSFSGNKNLNPELISTAEAQVFYQNNKIQTSLTYFNSHLSELIKRVPNQNEPGKMIYQNEGSFDFQGIEFEGKFALTPELNFHISSTLQQNVKDDSLKNAAYWPQEIIKAGISYKQKIITIGIWHSYFGMPTLIANPMVNSNPQPEAFNLLSANITLHLSELIRKDFTPAILFSIYGDNLLNTGTTWFPEYSLETVNSMPIYAGRSLYGKLILKI